MTDDRRTIVVVRHELFDSPTAAVLQRLSDGDRSRFEGLGAGRPRAGFLAGRRALVTAAARLGGVEASAIRLEATCPDCGLSHGRPVVDLPGVYVGLSHASGLAVAVAAFRPVGIDLERRDEPVERIAAAAAVTGATRGDALRHWVRAEAVLKADGRGLRVDPVRVSIRGRTANITDDAPRPDGMAPSFRLHPLRLRGHVGAVALAR